MREEKENEEGEEALFDIVELKNHDLGRRSIQRRSRMTGTYCVENGFSKSTQPS